MGEHARGHGVEEPNVVSDDEPVAPREPLDEVRGEPRDAFDGSSSTVAAGISSR